MAGESDLCRKAPRIRALRQLSGYSSFQEACATCMSREASCADIEKTTNAEAATANARGRLTAIISAENCSVIKASSGEGFHHPKVTCEEAY